MNQPATAQPGAPHPAAAQARTYQAGPSGADPLAEAARHLRGGRLTDAARLFRGVLQADPTCAEALTGLASEALARGSPAVARPLLARAAAIEPRNAATFAAMAQMHLQEGRRAEAAQCLAAAASLDPGQPDYRIGQALLAAADGGGTSALAQLHDLARQHPGSAPVHHTLGAVLLAQGRVAEAHAALVRATRLDPEGAETWHALGVLLAAQGRAGEARDCLQTALDLAPTSVRILAALSELLLDAGDAAASERLAREGGLVAPASVELTCVRGLALAALGRCGEAAALLAAAARDAPASPVPLLALADVFLSDGQPDKAAAFSRAALALPGLEAPARLTAAGMLLRAGRVSEGWAAAAAAAPPRPPPGTRLRLRAPRILADTLLFLRWCPLAAAAGWEVRLAGVPALAPLLANVPGLVLDDDADTGSGAGSDGNLFLLGAWLAPEPADAPPPPLSPDPAAVASWRTALAAHPAPHVAVAWGGPGGLTLDDVLAAVPAGGTAVSVMTGPGRDAIHGDGRVLDAGWQIGGYPAMAALLQAVDLVLLPDGPAAHLAGALNRPGIVHAPPGHLAWAAPWYPSLHVIRHWDADAARAALGGF